MKRSDRHFSLHLLMVTAPLWLAMSCLPGTSSTPPESTAGHLKAILRTADPVKRGFSETEFPRIQELAPQVYSYEQLRSSGEERFTTVSFFVVTPEGVLVADGQGSLEETRRLVEEIGKVTDQPIRHVVICSDHGDHTGGNRAFPSNAEFYVHPTSLAILQRQAAGPRGPGGEEPAVMPGARLVDDELTINLGGRLIQILFLGRAHTGGDLSVYLPEEKVLFMSEAFLNRIFPAMRSAFPSEWVEMIERAQALEAEIYVPGHGFVESPPVLEEELETFREAIVSIIGEARRLQALGLSATEAAEQADFGELATWSLYSSQAPRAIEQVYKELSGELP